jgi:hypothetical protein
MMSFCFLEGLKPDVTHCPPTEPSGLTFRIKLLEVSPAGQ